MFISNSKDLTIFIRETDETFLSFKEAFLSYVKLLDDDTRSLSKIVEIRGCSLYETNIIHRELIQVSSCYIVKNRKEHGMHRKRGNAI